MDIIFKNSQTGEVKPVKFGWSWTLFLFSIFFGIPLFMRKLYLWGSIWFIISTIAIIDEFNNPNDASPITLLQIGLSIFFAIKGNEITAKKLLRSGWYITNTDNDFVKMAMGKWGVSQ